MKFNKSNLKTFLFWIKERHSIYLKKESGKTRPWTKDAILNEYKFTNPFRQNDRVTKELTKRIEALPKPKLGRGAKKQQLNPYVFSVFRTIIIFRMFNWPETFDVLKDNDLIDNWNITKAKKVLKKYKKEGNQIFTGAYIITANGQKGDKIDMVCNAINKIIKDQESIVHALHFSQKLERSVEILSEYPMIGGFIGYELVTDLRHTCILDQADDIYKWANPGPGAKRGIHRLLFDTTRGEKPKGEKVDYQLAMQSLMDTAQNKLGALAQFKDVRFEMRDIEHSLCEFDKYMRVKNAEGKPRSKYKGE